MFIIQFQSTIRFNNYGKLHRVVRSMIRWVVVAQNLTVELNGSSCFVVKNANHAWCRSLSCPCNGCNTGFHALGKCSAVLGAYTSCTWIKPSRTVPAPNVVDIVTTQRLLSQAFQWQQSLMLMQTITDAMDTVRVNPLSFIKCVIKLIKKHEFEKKLINHDVYKNYQHWSINAVYRPKQLIMLRDYIMKCKN